MQKKIKERNTRVYSVSWVSELCPLLKVVLRYLQTNKLQDPAHFATARPNGIVSKMPKGWAMLR